MTIIGGPTWCLRLVTFVVHVPFSLPFLLILAFQPVLFHTIITDGHYMLFSMEEFFKKKIEQSCLTLVCQMTCQRSHISWCASCWHNVFASSVCFGSFKNLILSGFVRDRCCFPSRRLLYTSICLSIFVFLRSMSAFMRFILLFVDFVRYLTFWHDIIQIYRCSRKTSVDYFVLWRYGIDQALFH